MDQSPIHSSLDSNHDQLRLLILHSGNQDDPIHCSLKTCLISETEPYEALSYVWGDATITTPIYIGPLHKKFEVTTNLACALSHLRLQDHDRVLWVDALCINQDDDREKSHQVRMMRKIYEGAECVVAWLGPETTDAEDAIRTLELLANDANLHWRPGGRSGRVGPSITAEQALRLYTWFHHCNWWTRIWTVQEYAMARELIFRCGNFSIQRRQIERLAQNFFDHIPCCPVLEYRMPDGEETMNHIFVEVVTITRIEYWPENPCLLATTFRQRQATRPEDKIFGLAGLMDGLDEEMIQYGTSVRVVYEKFMDFVIENSRSLDPLSQVVHLYSVPLDVPISAATNTLPSWVENFEPQISITLTAALRRRLTNLRLYDTSSAKHCKISKTRSGLLDVDGVLWDTITSVGQAVDDVPCPENIAIAKSWYRMAVNDTPDLDYIAGGKLENALWRTMCGDIVIRFSNGGPEVGTSSRFDARADDVDFKIYMLWWQALEKIHDSHADRRPSTFDESVFISICCRRFIITEKGYIGLAPAKTEPGDRIAVLFGGRVPYILRQNQPDNSTEPTTWTFIGDSYVHGIMDGEVIQKLERGEVESEVITLK